MSKRMQLIGLVCGAGLAASGCATQTDDGIGAAEDDASLYAEACAELEECSAADAKADGEGAEGLTLFGQLRELIVGLHDEIIEAQDENRNAAFEVATDAALGNRLFCPDVTVDRFDHFVDLVDPDTSTFTSVQDFYVVTDDSPTEVLERLRREWNWWQVPIGDSSVPQSEEPKSPYEYFEVDIRPLGLPLVNIEMSVPPVLPDCSVDASGGCISHPALDSDPDYEGDWDAGVEIAMDGNAFRGTFFMFARRDGDRVYVREMWYRTQAVSPLVRTVLTVVEGRLRPRSLPNVGVFLHLLATQGCVPFMQGTGYPGLIDAIENADAL